MSRARPRLSPWTWALLAFGGSAVVGLTGYAAWRWRMGDETGPLPGETLFVGPAQPEDHARALLKAQRAAARDPTKPYDGLDGLHPTFRMALLRALEDLRQQGYEPKVYETIRIAERQRLMYDRGASKVSQVGPHHYGLAADIIDGRPHPSRRGQIVGWGSWHTDTTVPNRGKHRAGDLQAADMARDFYEALGRAARAQGLVWGGDWRSFVDKPHVEHGNASTLIAQMS